MYEPAQQIDDAACCFWCLFLWCLPLLAKLRHRRILTRPSPLVAGIIFAVGQHYRLLDGYIAAQKTILSPISASSWTRWPTNA